MAAPLAVGFSQEAPFALALAANGSDELAHPRFADALPPEVRSMVDAVADDPLAAEASFAGFGSADALWRHYGPGRPDDPGGVATLTSRCGGFLLRTHGEAVLRALVAHVR
ncbi:hypothetical protein [Streptomyces sp. FZ201]|uniref:hypothetical protein n=1 Tax=Streptomyces sp. FZ201 TaxID=3057122 RepID=UPI0021C03534|nr:hypothetical protein [Streptomyces sp. FZ201]